MNKNTLLYYDKIDLFKLTGTKENGYRYYMVEEFDSFIAIQSLRANTYSVVFVFWTLAFAHMSPNAKCILLVHNGNELSTIY